MDRVTKPQKKMLITLLRETKFMEGKKEKEWYWEKIQAALNSIGPKKTIIQWKKCWRDMRLTTRKKLAELKRCQLAGGSPPPGIELNQEDNDIIDIVGAEYFYEEMNGELKPENFLSTFDYAPEHFCDAILTAAGQQSAAAAAAATHMQSQHVKEQQQQQHNVHQQQQQQQPPTTEHHGNENEGNETGSATETHQTVFQNNVGNMNAHAEEQNVNVGLGISSNTHSNMPHHGSNSLHGGLHSHLLRRQQQHQHVANAAFQRDSMFEEKLLQLMHDVFPKRSKKRNYRDPDKLFLLSLYDEMKRIPEELRLDVKSELIQVIKRYQKHSTLPIKQESAVPHVAHKQNLVNEHSAKMNAHNIYQMSGIAKREQEPPSPQAQHALDGNVATVHVTQQLPHPLYQLQKKYEDVTVVDKQQQQQQQQQTQNEQQRKQTEAVNAVHHQQQQHAPAATNSNDPQQQQGQTHMHHPQIPHGILFPLPPQQQQQQQQQPPPPLAQQHAHNPHNPHQQHQQQQQQQQQQQPSAHHTTTIFGGAGTDRPTMTYETVG